MSMNFYLIARLWSEGKDELIKGERLQVTVDKEAAHFVWPTHQSPGRNEWSGNHCSLLGKEEEINGSSCQMCRCVWFRGKEDKKVWSDSLSNSRLVGAADTSRELAEWHRLCRKA